MALSEATNILRRFIGNQYFTCSRKRKACFQGLARNENLVTGMAINLVQSNLTPRSFWFYMRKKAGLTAGC